MEFEDEIVIETDSEHVWSLVSDPEVLASCVPGIEEVEKLSETKYEGTITRGISQLTVSLSGEVELVELNEPDQVVAKATGSDPKTNSNVDVDAEMLMAEADGGQTELAYEIDLTFTGRLASLGSFIVRSQISSDIDTFFDNLREHVENEQEQ